MEFGWTVRNQFPKNPHLCDIYQRCNVVVLEPIEFEEAEKDEKWINDMKKELKMIGKNWHLELVNWPQNKQSVEWNGFIELN